jgi:spore coat protein A
MKFVVKAAPTSKNAQVLQVVNNVPATTPVYPTFTAGTKVFTTLFELMSTTPDGVMVLDGMMINGLPLSKGVNCSTALYNIGQTYDFYIINLTPDTHPMHFHLINFQVIKQYPIDVIGYENKYFALNGGRPTSVSIGFGKPEVQLDPELYRSGPDILPPP